MFCIQCEQTIRSPNKNGCMYSQGMCGKTEETADLQDILVKWLQGLSFWANLGRKYNIIDAKIDRFATEALFSTLTNVNFDSDRIESYIKDTQKYTDILREKVENAITVNGDDYTTLTAAAKMTLPENKLSTKEAIPEVAFNFKLARDNEDTISLHLLNQYGIKGAGAYLEHAQALGKSDESIFSTYHQLMSQIGDDDHSLDTLFDIAMQIGQLNYKVMDLLDQAENEKFGHPEPTKVNTQPIEGKCILISGHDLNDLDLLLKQT